MTSRPGRQTGERHADHPAAKHDRRLRGAAQGPARRDTRSLCKEADRARPGRGRCPAGGSGRAGDRNRRGRFRPFGHDFPLWWPDWRGDRIVIVAGGPSAAEAPITAARGRARVIAINTGWRLCPWADALYACDYRWWEQYPDARRDFGGLKISADERACREWGLARIHAKPPVQADVFRAGPPGHVGWGGNSGFHMLNLAVQLGARQVLLVGYDMRIDRGIHWHGPHPKGMHNPRAGNVDRWRRCLDATAPAIAAAGVEVINCSAVSSLTAWPKRDLKEALEC